jgi:hypothetical protein
VGKLIGLVILVAIGVGIYFIGRAVEGESNNAVVPVVAIPDQAATTVAETNLSTAAQAASTYYSEHGSYVGMSPAALAALLPEAGSVEVKHADATSYCIQDIVRTSVAHLTGPGGTAAAGPCT